MIQLIVNAFVEKEKTGAVVEVLYASSNHEKVKDTWGILDSCANQSNWQWITPTYMGNTRTATSIGIKDKDHPHIHGEYMLSYAYSKPGTGSPPHTWGIQVYVVLGFAS